VPQHLFCACISSCFYISSAGSSVGGKERGVGGQARSCTVIVIVPSSHLPICPPCRSCPGCTAASCRRTHGPGQTDRERQTRLPKCQDASTQRSKSDCPFLFLPFHLHVFLLNLSLLMALQLTLCLHLQSARQNFAIVSKSRDSMLCLTVQSHSPS
jgi:hypothetical protein